MRHKDKKYIRSGYEHIWNLERYKIKQTPEGGLLNSSTGTPTSFYSFYLRESSRRSHDLEFRTL